MSGIAGVFFRDGRPADETILKKTLAVMSYRGPDGSGNWTDGAVSLGGLMLRTTPESVRERYPKMDYSGRYVLTADACLYNRDELLERLGVDPTAAHDVDDGDLILKAHRKWGDAAPQQLDGDFAYCLWDRAEEKLVCARDAFGVRPLYYYVSDAMFAFASEIRPLLEIPRVPRRLNEIMVGDYLVGLKDDKEITFYAGILRLAPGHSMTVTRAAVHSREYWSLDPHRELRLGSDDEYAEAFRELFTQAVRRRCRSAYPVGSHLSGGLDSSSVTCVARAAVRESSIGPLYTLSATYDHLPICDEQRFIRTVTAQGGVKPLYVPTEGLPIHPYLESSAGWEHDDPFDAPSSFWDALVGVLTDDGVRVILDGFDGDNTVSHGTAYLAELASRMRIAALVHEVRALATATDGSFTDLMWRKAIRPLTPAPVRRMWRRVTGHGNRSWPKPSLISPQFAEKIGADKRYRAFRGFYLQPMRNAREQHYRGLTWGGLTHNLEGTNKLAARYAVEYRHPFFDRSLAEFCVALPSEQKIANGYTRNVMRRAMKGILPDDICVRTDKTDFSPSLLYDMNATESSLVQEVVQSCRKATEDYIDTKAFDDLTRRFLADPSKANPFVLSPVLTLGLWLRRSGLTP